MINLACSSDLRMFLCALYAPVCIVYGQVSMPCRSLCQRAKHECHKLMEIFGVAWPDDMECSRCVCVLHFKTPEYIRSAATQGFIVCMLYILYIVVHTLDLYCWQCVAIYLSVHASFNIPLSLSKTSRLSCSLPHLLTCTFFLYLVTWRKTSSRNEICLVWLSHSYTRFPDCDEPYPRPEDLLTDSDPVNQSSMTVQRDYGFWCPRELKVDPDLGYTFMGRKDCSAPCPSMYFSQQELTFIRYFIGVVSIVCLSATLFTFLTFLIDVTRFEWLNILPHRAWSCF